MKSVSEIKLSSNYISSLTEFGETMNSPSADGILEICFVRAVGTNASFNEDIKKLDETLDGKAAEKKLFYKRIGSLATAMSKEDSANYIEFYDAYIATQKRFAPTKLSGHDVALRKLLGQSFSKLEEYCVNCVSMNESILKNMIIKHMSWFDTIFMNEEVSWDEYQPKKLVFTNLTKKHEYLFAYFLTLVGCDVLLLQTKADIDASMAQLELSQTLKLGDFRTEIVPPYVRRKAAPKPTSESVSMPIQSPVQVQPPKSDPVVQTPPPPAQPQQNFQTNQPMHQADVPNQNFQQNRPMQQANMLNQNFQQNRPMQQANMLNQNFRQNQPMQQANIPNQNFRQNQPMQQANIPNQNFRQNQPMQQANMPNQNFRQNQPMQQANIPNQNFRQNQPMQQANMPNQNFQQNQPMQQANMPNQNFQQNRPMQQMNMPNQNFRSNQPMQQANLSNQSVQTGNQQNFNQPTVNAAQAPTVNNRGTTTSNNWQTSPVTQVPQIQTQSTPESWQTASITQVPRIQTQSTPESWQTSPVTQVPRVQTQSTPESWQTSPINQWNQNR